jgi:hypothetical protein
LVSTRSNELIKDLVNGELLGYAMNERITVKLVMHRWKASGEYSKQNFCIIEDSKYGNKQFRKLLNSSKFSITGSVNKKD